MTTPTRCVLCNSEYLTDINPRTGFPFHYCRDCRGRMTNERGAVADTRKQQSAKDKRKQVPLWE